MSRYKPAVQGLEGSQVIPGFLHQCVANELFRTYIGLLQGSRVGRRAPTFAHLPGLE